MFYELRQYQVAPGRMPALLERFRDHTVRLFTKHGIKSIGYWTYSIGGPNDTLIYLVAFESMEQREKAWDAFRADQEWAKIRAESEKGGGPIVIKVTNQMLAPTVFSPLQ